MIDVIGIVIIIVCSLFQLKFFLSTRRLLLVYKDIFPVPEVLGLEHNPIQIKTEYNNPVFKEIISSLNKYLAKNQGSVSDFNLMKDIVERNSSSVDEEIDSQISLPINVGLMGTMVGIIFGVMFLLRSGVLDSLVSGQSANISGINALLEGVAIAMVTSVIGIILSTILTVEFKRARKETEKEKNDFLTWVQSELLPSLSTDFTSVINDMTLRLSDFNKTFSTNVQNIESLLGTVRDTTANQASMLETINNLKINKIAKANIEVYEKLQNCTEELALLAEYLDNSRAYVQAVTALNNKLDASDQRIQTIERMGHFFIEERSKFDKLKQYIGESEDAMDEVVKAFKLNTKEQFDQLIIHTSEQRERYEKLVVEEVAGLQNKMKEISIITDEIKQISGAKVVMSDIKKAILQQNTHIQNMVSALKESKRESPTGYNSDGNMSYSKSPLWLKITLGVLGGMVGLSCVAQVLLLLVSYYGW